MFLFQMHWKRLTKTVCILMINEIAPKDFLQHYQWNQHRMSEKRTRTGKNWRELETWPPLTIMKMDINRFLELLKNIATASFSRRCLNTWRRVVLRIWFNKSTTVENRQWLTCQHLDRQSVLMHIRKKNGSFILQHHSAKSWERVVYEGTQQEQRAQRSKRKGEK